MAASDEGRGAVDLGKPSDADFFSVECVHWQRVFGEVELFFSSCTV
jgi:hypothetical protein